MVRARVAVVGDYQPENETHVSTDAALEHAGLAFDWLGTEGLDAEAVVAYDGVWIAPASPYRDTDAALDVIRLARQRGVPLVGT